MATQDKRRAGGAKPARTETVSVRLDPKLRYLAELAARKQRRTLSSYIEWAVETSLKEVKLYEGQHYEDVITVEAAASALWDVDEAERFIRLAINYPELLNHEEQEKWKLLLDSNLLEPAKRRDSRGTLSWHEATLEDVIYPVVRQHWASLREAHDAGSAAMREWIETTRKLVASGEVYPTMKKSRPSTTPTAPSDLASMMDDDIPF